MPAGFGACGSLYYAWLGIPLPACRKHTPDDRPHGQLCQQHHVDPNGRLLSPKPENQEECVPCSLLHVRLIVQSLSDDFDCRLYPPQGHQ